MRTETIHKSGFLPKNNKMKIKVRLHKLVSLLLISLCLIYSLTLITACSERNSGSGNPLFVFDNNQETRWSSPENPNGEKGKGGMSNFGAKGHPCDSIAAGQSYTLLDVQHQGKINRIWITISDRSPAMLRSLKIEMYWDNETKPAVSVPFGDFFGVGLGKTTAFQNALFANAEGRSFNCFIPMPFKKAAKIVVVNESRITLDQLFFDVDYSLTKSWNEDNLYFHAFWQRDTATMLSNDFELLPEVEGRGRFLGTNIGVSANLLYKNAWFGEGEVKMYLDGDRQFPTLNGTGTEDYIGTAYGQGKFINNFSGCTVADTLLREWAFYRFHIPDPVFFKRNIRVTLQQISGNTTAEVVNYQQKSLPLIPITTNRKGEVHKFYQKGKIVKMDTNTMPQGWTNFYTSDDVSATAYFYLDKPSHNLPALQPVKLRTVNLRER